MDLTKVSIKTRGEQIREFILDNTYYNPHTVASLAAEKFGVSRQAVNIHVKKLIDAGALEREGSITKPIYKLVAQKEVHENYDLTQELAEYSVWSKVARDIVEGLPENVVEIWEYGITEMINNAIDHSNGKSLNLYMQRFENFTVAFIVDDGVGIFRKIKDAMGLDDERHAVLELAKGKFTTDPTNHSGEGIFFTSRVFTEYQILSGEVYFAHEYDDPQDWIAEASKPDSGTTVGMMLRNDCKHTISDVFSEFEDGENHGFTRTVVPVSLAQYGDDTLVSRSQAKRLLVRIDRFNQVLFDFDGVERIGQAFADEVFRVFLRQHPEISISYINATEDVENMIRRAYLSEN